MRSLLKRKWVKAVIGAGLLAGTAGAAYAECWGVYEACMCMADGSTGYCYIGTYCD